MSEPSPSGPFRLWHAAAFLGAVSALSAVSSLRDRPAYQGSSGAPGARPAWLFPAVWTGLNILQLWADLRVLNDRSAPDRNTILGLRAINWTLYALFTPRLFSARRPLAVEVVTLADGVTAGASVALLARRDPLAAAALVPLPLWTAYAGLVGGPSASANPDSLVDRLRWGGAI